MLDSATTGLGLFWNWRMAGAQFHWSITPKDSWAPGPGLMRSQTGSACSCQGSESDSGPMCICHIAARRLLIMPSRAAEVSEVERATPELLARWQIYCMASGKVKGQRVHRDGSHTYESICAQENIFGTSAGINMLINPTRVRDRKGSVTSLAKADDEKLVQHVQCFCFKKCRETVCNWCLFQFSHNDYFKKDDSCSKT